MEGSPIYPHKSPNVTVNQNWGRRVGTALQTRLTGGPVIPRRLPPHFSVIPGEKVLFHSSKFPEALSSHSLGWEVGKSYSGPWCGRFLF